MNEVVARPNGGDIMEQVIIKGDLSKLSPQERVHYYNAVCQSVGLNPLTSPFAYITLNGKLTLYATRTCTDQLRAVHKVSVEDMTENEREGVYIVTCKVRNGEGRTDMAKGAVTINGLKGDALANAMMKAETKAKRRATLSVCGLGLLDETEVETIQNAQPVRDVTPKREPAKPVAVAPPVNPETGEFSPHMIAVPLASDGEHSDWMAWGSQMAAAFKASKTREELLAWQSENMAAFNNCKTDAPKIYARLLSRLDELAREFGPNEVTAGSDEEVSFVS